jgi:phosphate starvation-inducible PhoH-like protein
LMTTSPRQSKPLLTDANHFVLTFENNRYASELFGQFDQNLKLIEQRLKIEAHARGNSVAISGDVVATNQARRALDYLYGRLQGGGSVELSDVEGAIRMAVAADDQLSLPTMERKAKLTMAQISTRKKTIAARTPTQDAYIRALERSELVFGVGPAGTGKTYLAVAYAAQLLERGAVDRIVLSRRRRSW